MASPLKISLGDEGVDLVTSPIHLPLAAWVLLQNAQFSSNQGQRGIKKRGGLAPLNEDVLAGPVLAASAIPLRSQLDAGPVTSGILLSTGSGFLYAADGVTFLPLSAVAPIIPTAFPWAVPLMVTVDVDGADHTFYVGLNPDDGDAPWLYDFDGNTATPVVAVGGNAVALATIDNKVYMAVNSGPTFDATGPVPISGRVIEWDPSLGLSQTIGEAFGEGVGEINQNTINPAFQAGYGLAPSSLVAIGSVLYVGLAMYHTTDVTPDAMKSAGVAHLTPSTESSWTIDGIFGNTGQIGDVYPYSGAVGLADGDLYLSFNTFPEIDGLDPAVQGRLIRDPFGDGDEYPNNVSNPGRQWFGAPITSDGEMFVASAADDNSGTGASVGQILRRTAINDLDFAVELDVLGDFGGSNYPGQPYEFDGDLYWPWYGPVGSLNAGFLLKRDAGSDVWTQAATGLDLTGSAVTGPVPV